MAKYDAWAWYGAAPRIPTGGDDDLDDSLNNTSYGVAPDGDLAYTPYGSVTFESGSDTTVDDSDDEFLDSTDGVNTPDGTDRDLQEIAVYNDSSVDYELPDGTTGQLTGLDMHVYQIDNGDAMFRITDPALQNAYDDTGFLPGHATNITLGTRNDLEFGSMYAPNFNAPLPCFTRGTRLRTARGQVPVEELVVGDSVVTLDHGPQPVRWIGSRPVSGAELASAPEKRPIRIRAGALGGTPERDLVVSPQHRILLRSRIAERMFGCEEVLVAARQLLGLDGVETEAAPEGVEYFHFLCDDHQVVLAEGALTETLFTGPEALKGVGADARREILDLFPELAELDHAALAAGAARTLVPGRRARTLVRRHVKNGAPVAAPAGPAAAGVSAGR